MRSKNGFYLTEIFLRGGFHLRNTNLDFMDLLFCVPVWEIQKKKDCKAVLGEERSVIMHQQWVHASCWRTKLLKTAFDCNRNKADIQFQFRSWFMFAKIGRIYLFHIVVLRRRQRNMPRVLRHVQSFFFLFFAKQKLFAVVVCKSYPFNCSYRIGDNKPLFTRTANRSFFGFPKRTKK